VKDGLTADIAATKDGLTTAIAATKDSLAADIAATKVWAFVLYVALAASIFGTMARGFGWI
jgi:hypothetical protein